MLSNMARLQALWVLLLIALLPFAIAQLADNCVNIDCGGNQTFYNTVNQTWESDRFYSGGYAGNVAHPANFPREQERTLRYFPVSQGKKNCYEIPVSEGRYMIEMFFAYDNYDGLNHSPSFDVSVEGTVVFSWRNPWSPESSAYGAYSDLYAFIHDGSATICFYSIGTDSPVIGSLELLEVDALSYDSNSTGQNVIIANYGRLTAGNSSFGPGFDNVTDLGGRSWDIDDQFTNNPKTFLSTQHNITGADVPPNNWPMRLYETCRYEKQAGYPILYDFLVDGGLDYQVWFHLAEIDPSVIASGLRVFNITVNGIVAFSQVDIYKAVGPYTAYDLEYTVKNLTASSIVITLVPVVGSPLICGLEVLAIVQADIATNITEAAVMHTLKAAWNVPERMGWNGDPCAPTDWDTWEGVTCNLAADESSLIVTHIDVSDQGLTGILPAELTQLSNLISLNASTNMIEGPLPAGLGSNNLTSVDLSFNALVGPIPISLGSPDMQHLRLDNNHLSGPVPESVYTIGVHGGYVNLADNQGLCGVPSLPNCPGKGGPSPGSVAGIVILLLAALGALLGGAHYFIQRRSQEDYNFNLPHQLVERTKWYQQHKMAKESDPEGVSMISNRFGFSSNIAANQ